MILALAGGVGGAKLARGLMLALPPDALTVVVNTADDFEHLGLSISPDIDTVTYTLAGLANRSLGWGLEGDGWTCIAAIERLGGEGWFRLGDQDLATHILRTHRLKRESLSEITADFTAALGVPTRIVPMSDEPVRSMIDTDEGVLSFQDYFVRRRCEPRFRSISFDGADQARAAEGFKAALDHPALEAVILCPSNPVLSISPILAISGVEDALRSLRVPLVAVSPFIGGAAVKGPAGKIMNELDLEATPKAVADFYSGLLDGLVIDEVDSSAPWTDRPAIHVTQTFMKDDDDKRRLALETLRFAARLCS